MIARRILIASALLGFACAKQPDSHPPAQIAVPSAPADTPAIATAEAPAQPPKLTLERLPRIIKGPRDKQLLVLELEALEKLVAATPETARDRPTLLRRTGINYFELYLVLLAEGSDTKPALLEAEKHLQASGNALADKPAELYLLGLVREQLGNLPAAASTYLAVTQSPNLQPDVDARAHFGLGLIAEFHGKTDEAKREFTRAKEILFSLGFERDEDKKLHATIDEKLKAR